MSSPLLSIQQAIYDILTADITLMTKVTGVFDFVPDNQAYPYITIGETTSVPYETFDRHGEETTVTLHIWSRYLGFKEIDQITSDCNRLLSRQAFAVAGWHNVNSFFDYSETIRELDGITLHGIVRYRLLVLQD